MITVERKSDLTSDTYTFVYDERSHALTLRRWTREERPTKRHKFRRVAGWESYSARVAKDVPQDVLDEALRRFVETITVCGGKTREAAERSTQYGPIPPDFAHDPDGSIRAAWEAEQVKRGCKR